MADPLYVETVDRSGLERGQRALLPKRESGLRGGDQQREFLRLATRDSQGFCELVRGWGIKPGERPPTPERRFSEKEFVDPPWSTECVVAETWAGLPPSLAARPETWTRIHVELIEQGLIKGAYLAPNGNGESGRARIARVLKGTDPKPIDDCVRTVLRRLGGVIEARANRTAFLDCPLARAWWRHRYAEEAYETFGRTSIEALSDALRRPAFRWSLLVEAMVSKLTIVGDRAIRPALVQCLADGAGGTNREMANVLSWIGRRSTVQALGALGPQYVLRVVSEQFLGATGAK